MTRTPADPRLPLGVHVGVATDADVDSAARLAVEIAGYAGSYDDWSGRLARDVTGTDRELVVATREGVVVGYTRFGLVRSDEPAPDGYYLVGLMVDAAHRRHGIGEALVRRAVDLVAARADVLWSYYDADNEGSASLHARVGFVEVARGDIGFPGTQPDSDNVLVRLSLQRDASVPA